MYKKPDWAVEQITRLGGLVEDICKHGCGHPNKEWLKENIVTTLTGWEIHGCDGCCGNTPRDKLNRTLKAYIKKYKDDVVPRNCPCCKVEVGYKDGDDTIHYYDNVTHADGCPYLAKTGLPFLVTSSDDGDLQP